MHNSSNKRQHQSKVAPIRALASQLGVPSVELVLATTPKACASKLREVSPTIDPTIESTVNR